ncbi:helix-turn-helix domain-containing protein [Vagococcus elongatus]|uniref:HTH araC/xylS-type domain-containing protein n=1 Tax=Vagococcus elongatus TaxID=180344 RepID=A0A430B183_9ENTE|nr:AraC family transcriptional regulator [Vagococcus elongatus]RSU14076.1 hypothetical protein CBF29_04115 [Vagococcus elongatus]
MNNFPYISSDYFSEKFKPKELRLTKETMSRSSQKVFRDEIEFIYILSGAGRIEINDLSIAVTAGDFIQLMPYHVHRFLLKPKEKIQFYRIRFSIGLLLLVSTNQRNYLRSIKKIDNAIPIVSLKSRYRKQIEFLCGELDEEFKLSADTHEPLNLALISFISYIYSRHQNELDKKSVTDNLSWIVLQYLHLHHQEQLTPEKLGKALGISRQEVSKHLKSLTGMSFKQLLNQVRIRNAAALTQFHELSLNQIAQISGFQSEANFYKTFKHVQGVTPQEYRVSGMSTEEVSADIWELACYLLENCRQPLTITTAAGDLHFTEKKIQSLLKNQFQTTFKQFLNALRVQVGRNLLITLDKSINEIALLVGFQDALSFSRNFQRVYGKTPRDYLQQNQVEDTSSRQ